MLRKGPEAIKGRRYRRRSEVLTLKIALFALTSTAYLLLMGEDTSGRPGVDPDRVNQLHCQAATIGTVGDCAHIIPLVNAVGVLAQPA